VVAVEHGTKLVLSYLTAEFEIPGAACQPVARRFPGSCVVILDAAGNRVQVVELAALAELPDVEDLVTPSLRRSSGGVEETPIGARFELREPYLFLTSHRRVQVCARRSWGLGGEGLELCGLGHGDVSQGLRSLVGTGCWKEALDDS
jgi:hypothetical protein